MNADGYPDDLFLDEPTDPPVSIDAGTRELIRALTRIAVALETSGQRAVAPSVPPTRPALAPLPPVQTVATTPPCPNHGLDKVKPSTKFAGFYCTAKDPNGPRGYCSWQHRAA